MIKQLQQENNHWVDKMKVNTEQVRKDIFRWQDLDEFERSTEEFGNVSRGGGQGSYLTEDKVVAEGQLESAVSEYRYWGKRSEGNRSFPIDMYVAMLFGDSRLLNSFENTKNGFYLSNNFPWDINLRQLIDDTKELAEEFGVDASCALQKVVEIYRKNGLEYQAGVIEGNKMEVDSNKIREEIVRTLYTSNVKENVRLAHLFNKTRSDHSKFMERERWKKIPSKLAEVDMMAGELDSAVAYYRGNLEIVRNARFFPIDPYIAMLFSEASLLESFEDNPDGDYQNPGDKQHMGHNLRQLVDDTKALAREFDVEPNRELRRIAGVYYRNDLKYQANVILDQMSK